MLVLAQTSVRSNTRFLVGIVSSLDICDVVADDQFLIVFCSAIASHGTDYVVFGMLNNMPVLESCQISESKSLVIKQ